MHSETFLIWFSFFLFNMRACFGFTIFKGEYLDFLLSRECLFARRIWRLRSCESRLLLMARCFESIELGRFYLIFWIFSRKFSFLGLLGVLLEPLALFFGMGGLLSDYSLISGSLNDSPAFSTNSGPYTNRCWSSLSDSNNRDFFILKGSFPSFETNFLYFGLCLL